MFTIGTVLIFFKLISEYVLLTNLNDTKCCFCTLLTVYYYDAIFLQVKKEYLNCVGVSRASIRQFEFQ